MFYRKTFFCPRVASQFIYIWEKYPLHGPFQKLHLFNTFNLYNFPENFNFQLLYLNYLIILSLAITLTVKIFVSMPCTKAILNKCFVPYANSQFSLGEKKVFINIMVVICGNS